MSSHNGKMNNLKLKLLSATSHNLRTRSVENTLRNSERTLAENISLINSDCDFLLQKMQGLKQQISQVIHQITVINICSATEKIKIQNHLLIMNAHKEGFDVLFAKEREQSDLRMKELKDKEAQEEEELQKLAEAFEKNEQKAQEARAIEEECEALERECSVLKKRNKDMMLKLRRKLVEAQNTRSNLMSQHGLQPFDNKIYHSYS